MSPPFIREIAGIINAETYRDVAKQIAASANPDSGRYRFEFHEGCKDPIPHGHITTDGTRVVTISHLFDAIQAFMSALEVGLITHTEVASLVATMLAGNLPSDQVERERLELEALQKAEPNSNDLLDDIGAFFGDGPDENKEREVEEDVSRE